MWTRCVVMLIATGLAQAQSAHDWTIVPGVRVGPITASSTEGDLRKAFGSVAVVNKDVEIGEGVTEPGTVIDEKHPGRALAILWKDASKRKPATVIVCYLLEEGDCAWKTDSGIGMKTTLKELEARNGRPFILAGFGWDYAGTVSSWEGGTLTPLLKGPGRLTLRLTPTNAQNAKLTPKEFEAVGGEQLMSSRHPVMQKVNPQVYSIQFEFQ